MANLTGQQICATYGKLLQFDGGQLQDGLGNPISSLGNFSASYTVSSSYATTASYFAGGLISVSGSTTVLSGSTLIYGDTLISGSTTLVGTVVISGSQVVSGSSVVNGNFAVTGSTVLSGSTTIIGTTVISGSQVLSGSSAVNGYFSVTGSTVLSGSTSITGPTSITGSLVVTGGITGSLLGTASYSNFAATASYIDVTGSGVLVNWFGSQLQLTASSAGGASVTVDQNPPAVAGQGDLWWDTDDANMYMYYEYVSASVSQSAWVPATSLAVQAITADTAISSSYATTASYVNITGSGIQVNYVGGQIQLTGSGGMSVSASYALTASNYLMNNYSALEFTDDASAATAGVPLGGIYRTGNVVVVRIS